jgi:predicted transcriptional regulator
VFQRGKEEKKKAQRRTRKEKKWKKVLDKLPKVWYNEYVPKRDKRKIRLRLTAKMKGIYYD